MTTTITTTKTTKTTNQINSFAPLIKSTSNASDKQKKFYNTIAIDDSFKANLGGYSKDKFGNLAGNNFDLAEIGKEAENEALDDKAKMFIMSTVTDSVLRNVFKETAKEMWQVLCAKYEAKDVQGLNFTRRKFLNCKQENESVECYIDRVASLRDELEANEIEVDDLESIMTCKEFHQSMKYLFNC